MIPKRRRVKMRTRKVTMTVFCLEEDADSVAASLEDWFNTNGFPLTTQEVSISGSTQEEDSKACECFAVRLVDITRSES